MIGVDGSMGEGGGQIIRTAAAFSAVTGETVRVTNIRAGRPNPGLRPQHLKAVEAAAELCGGEVTGLSVGSAEFTFTPGEITSGTFKVDVGTAGSVTLVLQTLLPVAFKAPDKVVLDVRGGTDVRWSPTADYFEHVFLHMLRRSGFNVEMEVLERGFYPKGGGRVKVEVKPSGGRLEFTERGGLTGVKVHSLATEHLRGREVAERQAKGFMKEASPHHEVEAVERGYAESLSVGSSFTAYAGYDGTRLGVCVLGEKGVKAEDVGASAAKQLMGEMSSPGAVDSHMADQIIPYVALAGGRVKIPEVTGHLKTNADVVRLFGYAVQLKEGVVFNDPSQL